MTVEDTGCSQEARIPVTLTIEKEPQNIVKTQTIPIINPDEQQTVTFRQLGQVTFADRTDLRVNVKPVTGRDEQGQQQRQLPGHLLVWASRPARGSHGCARPLESSGLRAMGASRGRAP